MCSLRKKERRKKTFLPSKLLFILLRLFQFPVSYWEKKKKKFSPALQGGSINRSCNHFLSLPISDPMKREAALIPCAPHGLRTTSNLYCVLPGLPLVFVVTVSKHSCHPSAKCLTHLTPYNVVSQPWHC